MPRSTAWLNNATALNTKNPPRPTKKAQRALPVIQREATSTVGGRALWAPRRWSAINRPKATNHSTVPTCAATTTADGHVSALEGALLQGVAAALDCPLPPSIYRAG